jgi:gas vesicle protein
MKRILNIASVVLTAKALWWDKLSKEDQQRYITKAKGFINTHKDTLTEKGKQFVSEKKVQFAETKGEAAKNFADQVDSTEKVLDEKADEIQKNVNDAKKDHHDVPTPAEANIHPLNNAPH